MLCRRIVIGPCAFTTAGAATKATPEAAAAFKNLRRPDFSGRDWSCSDMRSSPWMTAPQRSFLHACDGNWHYDYSICVELPELIHLQGTPRMGREQGRYW